MPQRSKQKRKTDNNPDNVTIEQPPKKRQNRDDTPGESETGVVDGAHPNKTSDTGFAPSHWGTVRNNLKQLSTPKLVDFVEKAMETLSEERGNEYLQELIRKDFEALKDKLDNEKPLVVIITTHGSAIDRDKYNIFSRFHESVKKIKKSTYDFLKHLYGQGKTEAEKEENGYQCCLRPFSFFCCTLDESVRLGHPLIFCVVFFFVFFLLTDLVLLLLPSHLKDARWNWDSVPLLLIY